MLHLNSDTSRNVFREIRSFRSMVLHPVLACAACIFSPCRGDSSTAIQQLVKHSDPNHIKGALLSSKLFDDTTYVKGVLLSSQIKLYPKLTFSNISHPLAYSVWRYIFFFSLSISLVLWRRMVLQTEFVCWATRYLCSCKQESKRKQWSIMPVTSRTSKPSIRSFSLDWDVDNKKRKKKISAPPCPR